jgi:hypothetical protein
LRCHGRSNIWLWEAQPSGSALDALTIAGELQRLGYSTLVGDDCIKRRYVGMIPIPWAAYDCSLLSVFSFLFSHMQSSMANAIRAKATGMERICQVALKLPVWISSQVGRDAMTAYRRFIWAKLNQIQILGSRVEFLYRTTWLI